MYNYFVCMYICAPCACLEPMEQTLIRKLELEKVLSLQVGAGNQIQFLCKSSNLSDHLCSSC